MKFNWTRQPGLNSWLNCVNGSVLNWLVLSLPGDFDLLSGSHSRPAPPLPETPAGHGEGQRRLAGAEAFFFNIHFTCWLKLYLLPKVQDQSMHVFPQSMHVYTHTYTHVHIHILID
jgi:hypothetical protein